MSENKEKYMGYIKELYKKGYKYVIKVTDPNNKSYLKQKIVLIYMTRVMV